MTVYICVTSTCTSTSTSVCVCVCGRAWQGRSTVSCVRLLVDAPAHCIHWLTLNNTNVNLYIHIHSICIHIISSTPFTYCTSPIRFILNSILLFSFLKMLKARFFSFFLRSGIVFVFTISITFRPFFRDWNIQ